MKTDIVYVLTSSANGNVEMATTVDSEAFRLFQDSPGVYDIHIFIDGKKLFMIGEI